MSNPISDSLDALFLSDDLAVLVDYDFQDGTIAPQVPALVRLPDTEGDLGDVRISHDVRRFEIRTSDLIKEPARGHRINHDLAVYEVQSKPHKDRLGLVWIIDAYLVT